GGGAENAGGASQASANKRERDERSFRVWRASREERAKTLAQSLALILRGGVRANRRRRLQAAFSALRGAGVSARAARERRR
ncbi:unnamed protein product, partial [Laminaria digitata]